MNENRFDSRAENWDNKSARRALANAVAEALAQLPLSDEMEAMEFGCGTGLVGLQLAPRLGSVVAFDSSTGMIDKLKEKITEQDSKNVTPIQGDILTANFDKHFDFIFSSMTMHHIEEITPILSKLHSLVKKNGLFAIADLDAEDGSFHKPGSQEKHHGFKRSRLAEQLVKAGFSFPEFSTAHTIRKKIPEGKIKNFTVFLAVCRKQ